MTKILKSIFLTAVTLVSFSSCYKSPELPVEPNIRFVNVVYKKGQFFNVDEVILDSLIVTIDFEDGNGDLGLGGDETFPPYNEFSYFLDENNNILTISSNDTMPPYNCADYIINPEINGGTVIDTVYVKYNTFHYNFLVDFYIKENGVYKEYDFLKEKCAPPYDGRFPILTAETSEKALVGSLRYGMTSVGFESLFELDTLQLRIQIIDRALNKSNIVVSPDFTLQEVLVD